MRGKILLVSAVIALVAFSGVLFAMTSEEVSKLPLEERMKLEEEIRLAEQANQYLTVDRVDRIGTGSIQARGRFDYTIEWILDCSPQTDVALGPGVVDDTLLWVTAGGITTSGDPNWVFIYNLNTMTCVDSFLQPTTSTWGWRDLTYDGTYIYTSDGTGIDKIDPSTHAVVGTIYPTTGLSVHRAIGCDGDSMWAADWATDIWKFATDGSNAHSYFNDQSLYGLAYDPTGFIWGSAQEGDSGNTVVRYNASDLSVIEAMELPPEVGLAGGCELYNDSLLLYVDQSNNDVVAIRVHFHVYDHDVGVTGIIAPAGGYPVDQLVTPQVEVKNFGTNDETFDVTIEWPERYSETQAGIFVLSGDIDTVDFTPFTTVAGSYAVTAYTYLATDENPDNDTLEGSFGVAAWYENFELGDGRFESVVISNEFGAEWEWGICNSADYAGGNPPGPDAYSGTHCWATDLDGDYLNYADYYMWNEFIATADNPMISFYHWYNIFGYFDGGNVKLSTDGGGTWTVISPIGGYDDEGGSACNGESVFCYVHDWWEEVTFDLTPYSITEGQLFQIRWHMMSSTVVGDYPGWYVDDMSGVGMEPFLAEHDVGVHEILAPEELVDAGDVYPQVVVKNVGANEETFPVIFQIWGANKQDYTCTESVTLASGLMDTVDFTDPFAATGGSYTTLAYTALAEDEDPSNDSIWGEFSVVEWSEDLEEDDGGFEAILDDGFIGWQWGIPTNPEGPANAHSGENVWATNLAGDYDDDADFSLIRKFIALSDNPILYFWHWYDTENKWDGGNVKLSTDDGGSWTVISPMGGYDNVGYSACDYESLFTGHNQGFWELEGFYLSDYVGSGDLFLLNWHFRSDGSAGYYPGWHLDDFAGVGVEAFVPSHDVGIADIVAPVDVVEDGDIVAPEVVVENYGPVMDTFDVTLMIDPSFECNGDRQVYEEFQTVIVDAEATLDVVFPDWTALAGSYDVTAYTALASDTFYNNDTLTQGCIVASWIEDFEDGIWPPVGWAGYELGDPAGWEQLEDDAYSGVYCAYHDYWSGSPDDWLVTSAYSVGENAHLYFYQMDNWSGDYEYHGIWVSTGSGVPDADFSELVELGPATEDVWTIYGPANLCDYVGEQIYISFVYQGYFADEWYLDDIVGINLDPRIPYDVSVDDILIDERVDTLPQGTLLHPTAVVANNSPWGGPDLSFRVYYKIHKDGNIYWRRVYDVMNLPASTSDTVYFSGDVVLNEPGLYTVTVTIQTAFVDPILWNNTMTLDLYIGGAKMAVDELPKVFALHQNAPNPVRKNTSISYAIPRTSDVTIRVFDISGRVVKTLVNATEEAGYYTANWDMKDNTGREIASGIYFYEFDAGDFKSIKKMVVMR